MHEFSHQFPIAWEKTEKSDWMGKVWEIGSQENSTKPIKCAEPGKLALIIFP